MFGKKSSLNPALDQNEPDAVDSSDIKTNLAADVTAESGDSATMATPPSRGTGISTPGMTRRPNLGISAPTRPIGSSGGLSGEKSDGRTLVVGQGIRLAGEITSCECLIVEGKVEADLSECRDLDISAPGLFKGRAVVQNATISGLFDGELTVLKHLIIKNGGKVQGRLVYHEMEIERGGKVVGELVEGDAAPSETQDPNELKAEKADTTDPA